MALRNAKLQANPGIIIAFETLTGKRIRFVLAENTTLENLYLVAYQKREAQNRSASLEHYLRAINLFHQNVKLKSTSSTLRQTGIQHGSLIRVNFKKWVAGIGVDKATLSLIDPVTLDEVSGKPYFLEPGCKHLFDRESLTHWIEERFRADEPPTCPCCRTAINDEHIRELVPVPPQPDEAEEMSLFSFIIIGQPSRTLGFFSRGGNILTQPSAHPGLDSSESSEDENPSSMNTPRR